MERKFVADAMLGSLAKWLRALGYDAHYERRYKEGSMDGFLEEGRLLLSRNFKTVAVHPGSMLIRSEKIGGQMRQMREAGLICAAPERWFTRCLRCNVPLEKADTRGELPDVPEYVFHREREGIRRCPSCGRSFWAGTHRERMVERLRQWGF